MTHFSLLVILSQLVDFRNQFIAQLLQNGVVEVQATDTVQVQQRQHGSQGWQQDAILELERLDCLQNEEEIDLIYNNCNVGNPLLIYLQRVRALC